MLVVKIRLEQLIVILSIIKFLSSFRESIRNSLLFHNYKKTIFGRVCFFFLRVKEGKYKKLILVEIRANLFISR